MLYPLIYKGGGEPLLIVMLCQLVMTIALLPYWMWY